MITAMMISPLLLLFPNSKIVRGLLKRRRALGVAAFGYAAAHTILYTVDMGSLQSVLDEFWLLGIWTGAGVFTVLGIGLHMAYGMPLEDAKSLALDNLAEKTS